MGRRLLAHLFIALATMSLVGTYFVWVIDATLFSPAKLSTELKNSGVSSELANVLTDKVIEEMDGSSKEENRAKVANVITPNYIERKINETAVSLTTFMRDGKPQPTLNLTDFPGQVRAAYIELSDEEAAKFDQPIEFNKEEKLNWLPKSYNVFHNLKYIGIVLFVVCMVIELFLSPVGTKLKRAGRVFLYTSLWFFALWAVVIFLPSQFAPKAKQLVGNSSLNTLVDGVFKTIQHLFSAQFLSFAVICGVLAGALYALRHARKHVAQIQEVPTARIKSRNQVKLPR